MPMRPARWALRLPGRCSLVAGRFHHFEVLQYFAGCVGCGTDYLVYSFFLTLGAVGVRTMVTIRAKIVFLLGWLAGLMMMFTILQLGWLRDAYSRGAAGRQSYPLATPADAGYCPPCDVLFSKLERSPGSGTLVQRVEMQMRG